MPEPEEAPTAEGPQHEIVTGLGIDPGAPPETLFEFVGRLTMNNFVRASTQYAEAARGAKPIKWRLEFEALDVVRHDGTVAQFSCSPSMTRGDGVTPLGPGSAANRLALVWKGLTGLSMNPDDPKSAGFIGHAFRLQSRHYQVGRDRRTGEEYRVRVIEPLEHLGDQSYQYVGEVRKLPPREEDTQQAPTAPPPPPPAADEAQVAGQLVSVLAGKSRETAQAAVFASPLKAVPMLFGQNIIAALNPPDAPLVDVLIERGLVQEINGTITPVQA